MNYHEGKNCFGVFPQVKKKINNSLTRFTGFYQFWITWFSANYLFLKPNYLTCGKPIKKSVSANTNTKIDNTFSVSVLPKLCSFLYKVKVFPNELTKNLVRVRGLLTLNVENFVKDWLKSGTTTALEPIQIKKCLSDTSKYIDNNIF